jgi:pimeloyl-ACP methyl ester carboxylesterase
MDLQTFDAHRATATTASGPIAYTEIGSGDRTAVFVHGVGTNGALWRNVIERLAPTTRCIAIDLPLHGRTPAAPDQDFSLGGLAGAVGDLVHAIGLDGIDLVANDTGGAVAQVFAVREPSRLRTLALTNCDTHTNLPPDAFRPTVEAAAAGQLAPLGPEVVANPDLARNGALVNVFEHPERVPDEVFRSFMEPVLGTLERGRQFERMLTTLDAAEVGASEGDV